MKSAIASINSSKDFVSKGGPNVIASVKKGTKIETKNIKHYFKISFHKFLLHFL